MSSLHEKASRFYEGKLFQTNNFGEVMVLKYINKSKVVIKFTTTGSIREVRAEHLKTGNIKDYTLGTVFGVGVLGEGFQRADSSSLTYKIWVSMLQRCYLATADKYSSYVMCSVSETFKHYPTFKTWCETQVGFGSVDSNGKQFQLDKDIILRGNKLYSEDTCCFVPQEINNCILLNTTVRGECPVGVRYRQDRGTYQAYCSEFGKRVHLGTFSSETEAFYAYKNYKENYIQNIALKWEGKVDNRVYNSLLNWSIHPTD